MNTDLLPPIPQQPMDPSKPESVAMWKRQFFDPLFRILGKSSGLLWGSISKAGSSLKDLESRRHADLQEVKGWSSGTGTTQNEHISAFDGKTWDDHAKHTGTNHHGVDHDEVYASHEEVAVLRDSVPQMVSDELAANTDTDPTLAANSDSKIASQKATKSYADAAATAAAAGKLNTPARTDFAIAATCNVSGSFTISGGVAKYATLGPLCVFSGQFDIATVSSPNGSVQIDLPLPPTAQGPPVGVWYNNLQSASYRLYGFINVGTGKLQISEDQNGLSLNTAAQRLQVGSNIRFLAVYWI